MNRYAPLLLVLAVAPFLATAAHAQPREGRSLDVAVGLGVTAPYDESEVDGRGVIAKGEYVWAPHSAFGLRAYGGTLLTWPNNTDERCSAARVDCEVTSRIGLVGGKARVAAPIPWVAPFFELGVGLSFGVLQTRTPESRADVEGAAVHIPFSLGLALGSDHTTELAMVYYFHPVARQFGGGFTIGLSIPLDRAE